MVIEPTPSCKSPAKDTENRTEPAPPFVAIWTRTRPFSLAEAAAAHWAQVAAEAAARAHGAARDSTIAAAWLTGLDFSFPGHQGAAAAAQAAAPAANAYAQAAYARAHIAAEHAAAALADAEAAADQSTGPGPHTEPAA